jgi:hypothetical protein
MLVLFLFTKPKSRLQKKCNMRESVFAHTLDKSGAVLSDFHQRGIPLISCYCVQICCQQIVVDRAVGIELRFHLLAFIRLSQVQIATYPALIAEDALGKALIAFKWKCNSSH